MFAKGLAQFDLKSIVSAERMAGFARGASWVLTRVATSFIVSALIFGLMIDGNRLVRKTINFLAPESFAYLNDLSAGKNGPVPQKVREFLDYYRAIDRHIPDDPAVYGMMGFCYYHLNEYRKAFDLYARAVGIYPSYLNYYYNLAVILFRGKDYADVVKLLSTAVQIKPENNSFFVVQEKAVFAPFLKGFVDNEKAYAVKTKQDFEEAFSLLAASLFYLERYQGVVEVMDKAISQGFTYDGRFEFYRGVALLRLKRFGEALEATNRALDKRPDDPRVLLSKKILEAVLSGKDLLSVLREVPAQETSLLVDLFSVGELRLEPKIW